MDSQTEKKVYPEVASDYKLLEEIGRGASAVVYRAKCLSLDDYVAIKMLDLEKCNSSLDDIQRVTQTMSLINHPNVVKAHCSFVVQQTLWVVMPYIAGGSCLHIMKFAYPDGFEESIIASFLKETLKALEYLHHHGHIHRDVKAGNILVDGNGAVKLGDFGVSTFLFATDSREQSRRTFVRTPCWMAPEVMEQEHGYDSKADIWSVGITALELAHGHAPFLKYPPMKVLLMTLQNAPPRLDYERDRRFSKSFKEMVAMCLVKDPTRRPSAEKLVKHSFFKNAQPADYVVRTILKPLPHFWERVHDLKMKDAACLDQKNMLYGEQEEISQNEYKQGMSCWNFDTEDLKVQAALHESDAVSGKEENYLKANQGKESGILETYQALLSPSSVSTQDADTSQQLVKNHSLKDKTRTYQSGDCVMWGQPVLAAAPRKVLEKSRSGPLLTGKKQPLQIGRFDIFEDDPDQGRRDSSPFLKRLQQHREELKDRVGHHNKNGRSKAAGDSVTCHEKKQKTEFNQTEDREYKQEHFNEDFSGASVAESTDNEKERDKEIPSIGRTLDDNTNLSQSSKDKCSSGPSKSFGATPENQISNGDSGSSRSVGPMGSSEDKSKVPLVQQKGRFSVSLHDMDLQEAPSTSSQPVSPCPVVGLCASTVIPHLQILLNQNTIQQDLIVSLIKNVYPSEQLAAEQFSGFGSTGSTTAGLVEFMGELSTDRERALLAQVADLQCRVTRLADELQAIKLRNVQLEWQLNAISNKEEEERIRREEAENEGV